MSAAPDWQTAYLLASSVAVFALAAIAGSALHHRSAPGGAALAAVSAVAAAWTATTLMTGLSAPGAAGTWLKLRYTCAMLSPPTVTWFLLQATGRMPSRPRATVAALLALPLATATALWASPAGTGWVVGSLEFARTGAITHPVSVTPGPLWWPAIGWGYALSLGNAALACAWAWRGGPLARGHGIAAAVGIVVPMVANVALHLRLLPPWLDPMPLALGVTAAAAVHAVLRHRMLDIVPVARGRVVDAMDDGVLATDAEGRVVDLNPAMAAILGVAPRDALGRPAAALLAGLGDLAARLPAASARGAADDGFATVGGRHYGVRLVPLPGGPSGAAGGRLLLLHDLTARVGMERDRERLIGELRDALAQVRTLRGLLPLCASCKNVRDGTGRWRPVDAYIRDHSLATVSHGICPDCAPRRYPGARGDAFRDLRTGHPPQRARSIG